MDPARQQFLFSHILPGTHDMHYDKTRVDWHREEYGKLTYPGVTLPKTVDGIVNLEGIVNIAQLSSYLERGWIFVARHRVEKRAPSTKETSESEHRIDRSQ